MAGNQSNVIACGKVVAMNNSCYNGNEEYTLVDDDLRIQLLLKDELEEHGYHVTVVSNGKEAISHLMNVHKKPDLVILDVRVRPEWMGWRQWHL